MRNFGVISGRLRRAVGCITTIAFLVVWVFGTFHLATHDSCHKVEQCPFCKYYEGSRAESASVTVEVGHYVFAAMACPIPILQGEHSGVSPVKDPRGPPLENVLLVS